ncbi:MAG: YbgC/FadM family acyl-CoA thioesterase [Pikeienuella sp.]|uniref:YbgC/FadM family acyl-CoA thioesterase n=1 Tax=Pikeienuella sp. TaxID=2831957 RepID=UPI00391ADA61
MPHEARYRVHYEDVDMGAVVYHANYLRFIERARSEALAEAGVDQGAMRAAGLVFVVTRIEADFLSPARYGDMIRVETEATETRGASATLAQAVFREETPLFRARVVFACMTLEGRPVRLPAEARAALAAMEGER